MREARESRKAGYSDQAVEWANYSVKFSPDLPEPYVELARALWSKNLLQIYKPFSEIWKAQKARLPLFSDGPSTCL